MPNQPTLDIDALESAIRDACEAAGEPIYAVERNLNYQLHIMADRWALTIGNRHHHGDVAVNGRRWFGGDLTASAWAALRVVREALGDEEANDDA